MGRRAGGGELVLVLEDSQGLWGLSGSQGLLEGLSGIRRKPWGGWLEEGGRQRETQEGSMWTMELMGATPVGSILGTFWALWAPKGRPASQQQQQRPASQLKSGASPRVDASLGVDPASQFKSGASPRVDKA